MLIGDLGAAELGRRLRGGGADLRLSPFTVRLSSRCGAFPPILARMYADFPLADGGFADFHIDIRPRRRLRPQAVFELDGQRPFLPLPADHAYPMFEWGLNWCIVRHVQDYLMLHAAALERAGGTVILPGPPGSGKSTLAAGLAFSGWRLLSDELTLIRLEDGAVQGLARPVSLKNESIEVVRRFIPGAVLSPAARDTAKGTVCHLAPPAAAVGRIEEHAMPRWLVLPRFETGAETRLEPLGRAQAFMAVVDSAFNYPVLGEDGFELLAAMVERCEAYSLVFGSLERALVTLDGLAGGVVNEEAVS